MTLVRSFVAADLPDAVREDLVSLQQRLRGRGAELRWVATDAMHLTLKFLGELPEETFAAVAAALAPPLGLVRPLRLRPRALGAFPSPKRARILWVGLEGDVADLARVALTIEARVESAGVPREARPFAPHLTLGRSRGSPGVPGLEGLLRAEGLYEGPAFEVSELTLYESRLEPRGPRYLPRKIISLV